MHFPSNTIINELIKHSFIEECSSLLCSYTFMEKFDVFYIIILFLGLQGGLTIVLKWICPKLVRIISEIYYYRRRQI
ncbi:hypothetical protein I4U23_005370 [Adineta vaga]|nr:hypothetical protein I4U23_005370 [Adineta vaga]